MTCISDSSFQVCQFLVHGFQGKTVSRGHTIGTTFPDTQGMTGLTYSHSKCTKFCRTQWTRFEVGKILMLNNSYPGPCNYITASLHLKMDAKGRRGRMFPFGALKAYVQGLSAVTRSMYHQVPRRWQHQAQLAIQTVKHVSLHDIGPDIIYTETETRYF